MILALLASVSIIMIGIIFGLPKLPIRSLAIGIFLLCWITDGVEPKDYVDRICQKVIKSIDPHLPCPDDLSDLTERPPDRQALWSVIHSLCIPASYLGISFPCLKVDRSSAYAAIRSPSRSKTDIIITPTIFIEGVESLSVMRGKYPNLWKAGWMSRDLLREAAHRNLTWSDVVIAVNSKFTRGQDHLHLHMGCINRKLGEFIAAEAGRDGTDWRVIRPSIHMPEMFLKFVTQETIDSDIFSFVNHELPGNKDSVLVQTIALAGIDRGSKNGFALMVTRTPGPAETFLAPSC